MIRTWNIPTTTKPLLVLLSLPLLYCHLPSTQLQTAIFFFVLFPTWHWLFHPLPPPLSLHSTNKIRLWWGRGREKEREREGEGEEEEEGVLSKVSSPIPIGILSQLIIFYPWKWINVRSEFEWRASYLIARWYHQSSITKCSDCDWNSNLVHSLSMEIAPEHRR